MGDHRATGLVEQLIRTFEERLLVMAQESPRPSLEIAFLKLIKCSATLLQQSLNCSPVKARLDQHDWGKWSEKFQLTIIAKDSVDIEDLINPPGRPELIYPTAEWKLQRSNPVGPRKRTSKPALQSYNEEVRRRKAEDNAKFNGLRIGYIDKKLKSQLYLALGREGQKCFSHKNPGKRILDINFAEIWNVLKSTFTVTTNLTYERYKFFGRKQKNHESQEKFQEILSELAKNFKLGYLDA